MKADERLTMSRSNEVREIWGFLFNLSNDKLIASGRFCFIHGIWAMSWENLFEPHANNKGAGQPVHPRSPISTSLFAT